MTQMAKTDGVKTSSKLSQMVQIVVTGSCTTRPGVRMPGIDLIPVRADGTVKAVDLSTGDTIAQKSVSNVVGFGLTEEQAGIAALHKMGRSLAQAFLDELLAITKEQGK